jgi:hypothetical protein
MLHLMYLHKKVVEGGKAGIRVECHKNRLSGKD